MNVRIIVVALFGGNFDFIFKSYIGIRRKRTQDKKKKFEKKPTQRPFKNHNKMFYCLRYYFNAYE